MENYFKSKMFQEKTLQTDFAAKTGLVFDLGKHEFQYKKGTRDESPTLEQNDD